MTTTSALSLPFVGEATTSTTTDTWLNLEQVPLADNTVNLASLAEMYSRARSGLSARTLTAANCPITFDGDNVVVPVEFTVYPSSLDLAYRLAADLGEISTGQLVSEPVELDVVIPFQTEVQLPYIMEGATAVAQTPFYNAQGERLSGAGMVLIYEELGLIEARQACFCVLRVTGNAVGYRHTVTLTFAKGDDAITDVTETITAAWEDADGELQGESLELELPSCAADFLEYCADGELLLEGLVKSNDEKIPVVYYSDCSGKVVLVRYE